MQQPAFNWTAPISGRTARSRHASWTGSRHATKAMGERMQAVRQLLEHHGPISDQDMAAILKCGLSSINSCRNALERHGYVIIEVDFERVDWPDGGHTSRARRQIQRNAAVGA